MFQILQMIIIFNEQLFDYALQLLIRDTVLIQNQINIAHLTSRGGRLGTSRALIAIQIRVQTITIRRVEAILKILQADHLHVDQLVAIFNQLHQLGFDLHRALFITKQRALITID